MKIREYKNIKIYTDDVCKDFLWLEIDNSIKIPANSISLYDTPDKYDFLAIADIGNKRMIKFHMIVK